jgi:hypothetical protein
MKAYGGVDVQIHVFLSSALGGGEWSASLSDRFISVIQCIGGSEGPQSWSGRRGESKTLDPTGT